MSWATLERDIVSLSWISRPVISSLRKGKTTIFVMVAPTMFDLSSKCRAKGREKRGQSYTRGWMVGSSNDRGQDRPVPPWPDETPDKLRERGVEINICHRKFEGRNQKSSTNQSTSRNPTTEQPCIVHEQLEGSCRDAAADHDCQNLRHHWIKRMPW